MTEEKTRFACLFLFFTHQLQTGKKGSRDNPESLFSCWKARKISNQTDCCALRSFSSSRILVLNAPCSGYIFSIMKQRTPDSRGRTGR